MRAMVSPKTDLGMRPPTGSSLTQRIAYRVRLSYMTTSN